MSMEKNVRVISFDNEAVDINVAYEDVTTIAVIILSGDEVLTIFTKDGKAYRYDAADYCHYRSGRCTDDYYVIYPADFEKWDKRTSADPWAEGGYFSNNE